MGKEYKPLLSELRKKVDKSFLMIKASLEYLEPYNTDKAYTPKELEPYDALSDRFIRCVEVFIKFFKAYEYYKFSVTSDSLRDSLNIVEKLKLITQTPLWMEMRDVRNRIVHDYLPKQTKDMFDRIMDDFYKELIYSKNIILKLKYN